MTVKSKSRSRKINKSENKFGNIVKLIFWVIIFVVGIFFIYQFVVKQLGELRKLEFDSERSGQLLSIDQDPQYTNDKPFSLLVLVEFDGSPKDQIDGFVVVQLNIPSQSATLMSVSSEIYLYSQVYCLDPEDTNLVRIKDLFVVGELETPSESCSYTLYSIEEMLAVPIDGYLYIDGDSLDRFVQMGSGVRPDDMLDGVNGYQKWAEIWNEYWIDFLGSVNIFKIWRHRDVISSLESNMSVVDLYSFVESFKSVNSDNIFSVVVEDNELEEIVNNRGDIVSLVTGSSWDNVLKDYLSDDLVDREQARVEIFNGSQIDGLGSRYQRWIDHLGADVIRVQNAPGRWDNTTVYVTDRDEFRYTLDKIIGLWGNDLNIIEGRPDFITTGDIIVVLGLDFSGD